MSGLDAVRAREYPEPDGIFFNAAGWGLLPRCTVEAVGDLVERRNRPRGFDDAEFGTILRRARSAAARLIGAGSDEITLSPNTSFGVNLSAACVARGDPGAIVVSAGEFPANVYPWLALEERGFHVEVIPALSDGSPDEAALLAALDGPDVRVLALSHVQFATGYRADVAAFGAACRERGILFHVDAIQALGVVPLDVRAAQVDLLSCGGQKWLCSPWGSGFTFVDARLRAGFDPPMVSWLGMEDAGDFSSLGGYRWRLVDDGRRFELATMGLQDYLGLATSIELFLEIDPARVHAHLMTVHAPLLEWAASRSDVTVVTPLDASRRAGILSFRTRSVERAAAALQHGGVICAVREGMVRLAPHFYNTVDEMRTAVEILDRSV